MKKVEILFCIEEKLEKVLESSVFALFAPSGKVDIKKKK